MKDQDIERGRRVKQILEDPIMSEAKEIMDQEFYRQFKLLAQDDLEGVMTVKKMQYMHEKYWLYFQSVVNQGKLALLELERTRPRPKGY
jgi:hypothetical protein